MRLIDTIRREWIESGIDDPIEFTYKVMNVELTEKDREIQSLKTVLGRVQSGELRLDKNKKRLIRSMKNATLVHGSKIPIFDILEIIDRIIVCAPRHIDKVKKQKHEQR